ncbi:E3 ubiquitin-protein ligase TRAIP [Orchesella cincta]|uniref:E3 ubiquitin-protein ligase TRAIP n=1 Tax=Orchesella cincta TaxID=48709 RepID=A0A1D2NHZ6_ORCCI|nr:E3 ubiquitin-protein ligase TRAIP [Orchesella cincta]
MGFGCPICSEKLEKLPAEAQSVGRRDGEVNIAAAPCGHMFHSYCIQKWLTGNLASSKLCPCCRKDVPKLRCLSLFPTAYEEKGGGPTVVQCNHGETLNTLKNQVQRLTQEQDEGKKLYDLLSDDYDVLNNKYRQEKNTSDMWMMKAKQFESYQDSARQYESKNHELSQQLKKYTYIEALVKGVERSVQEELSDFPPTAESIRSLLEMKHHLNKELRSTSKKLNDANEALENMRKDKIKNRMQIEKLQKDLSEVNHVLEIARVNGKIRSSSPQPGPSRLFNSETPKAFKSKRRLQEPLSDSIASKNANTPGLDSDVDVFPSGVKSKKMKTVSSQAKNETSTRKKTTNPKKFDCGVLSPVGASQNDPSKSGKTSQSDKNTTIDLASDSADEMNVSSDDSDFINIRGSVPGAPLPIAANRVRNLQEKASKPVLGQSVLTKKKTFTFQHKL